MTEKSPVDYSGILSRSAALGFSLQIYFDFSGYNDMALGLALMMGSGCH